MFGFINSIFGSNKSKEMTIAPGVTASIDTVPIPKVGGRRKRKSMHKRQKKKHSKKRR